MSKIPLHEFEKAEKVASISYDIFMWTLKIVGSVLGLLALYFIGVGLIALWGLDPTGTLVIGGVVFVVALLVTCMTINDRANKIVAQGKSEGVIDE